MKFIKRLAILFFVGLPAVVFATDLGDISRVTTSVLGEVSELGNLVLFITGGAFLISSLIKFQQYKRSPQFTPISRPITELIAGLVLITLPIILSFTADNAIFSRSTSTHPYTRSTP